MGCLSSASGLDGFFCPRSSATGVGGPNRSAPTMGIRGIGERVWSYQRGRYTVVATVQGQKKERQSMADCESKGTRRTIVVILDVRVLY